MAIPGPSTVKVYYGKPMLPDVSRVLACLYEKDVKFDLVDMYEGRQLPPDFFKLQASTRVPVPGFEDGRTKLFESRAICRYISERYADHGNKYMLGRDLLERASIEQWLKTEEQSFDPPSRALIFYLAFAPLTNEIEPDQHLITQNEQRLARVLDVYEQRLGESKYLAGDDFSLADLSHLPNSFYLANSEEFWYLFDSRKNVRTWCENITNRPSWMKVVELLNKESETVPVTSVKLQPSVSSGTIPLKVTQALPTPSTATVKSIPDATAIVETSPQKAPVETGASPSPKARDSLATSVKPITPIKSAPNGETASQDATVSSAPQPEKTIPPAEPDKQTAGPVSSTQSSSLIGSTNQSSAQHVQLMATQVSPQPPDTESTSKSAATLKQTPPEATKTSDQLPPATPARSATQLASPEPITNLPPTAQGTDQANEKISAAKSTPQLASPATDTSSQPNQIASKDDRQSTSAILRPEPGSLSQQPSQTPITMSQQASLATDSNLTPASENQQKRRPDPPASSIDKPATDATINRNLGPKPQEGGQSYLTAPTDGLGSTIAQSAPRPSNSNVPQKAQQDLRESNQPAQSENQLLTPAVTPTNESEPSNQRTLGSVENSSLAAQEASKQTPKPATPNGGESSLPQNQGSQSSNKSDSPASSNGQQSSEKSNSRSSDANNPTSKTDSYSTNQNSA